MKQLERMNENENKKSIKVFGLPDNLMCSFIVFMSSVLMYSVENNKNKEKNIELSTVTVYFTITLIGNVVFNETRGCSEVLVQL